MIVFYEKQFLCIFDPTYRNKVKLSYIKLHPIYYKTYITPLKNKKASKKKKIIDESKTNHYRDNTGTNMIYLKVIFYRKIKT